MTRSFTVLVEKDLESDLYIAEVVELPGCFTQARDLDTLKANVIEAIQLYLETTQPEEPLPRFVETYTVEVAA